MIYFCLRQGFYTEIKNLLKKEYINKSRKWLEDSSQKAIFLFLLKDLLRKKKNSRSISMF